VAHYLHVHDDAYADLDKLWDEDEAAAARIEALLEEIEGDTDLLDRLSQNGYGRPGRDDFNVVWLENQIRVGNNLWRLKMWDVKDHRVIYAFFPSSPTSGTYHVLGVMRRAINYDRNHEFIQRIESAYTKLRNGDR